SSASPPRHGPSARRQGLWPSCSTWIPQPWKTSSSPRSEPWPRPACCCPTAPPETPRCPGPAGNRDRIVNRSEERRVGKECGGGGARGGRQEDRRSGEGGSREG